MAIFNILNRAMDTIKAWKSNLDELNTRLTDLETDVSAIAQMEVTTDTDEDTNITSATPSDVNYATVSGLLITKTDCKASDIYKVYTKINLSGGSTSDQWYVSIHVSGAAYGDPSTYKATINDTSGKRDSVTLEALVTGITGSKNFEVKWGRLESASGGTIYSRRREITVMRFRSEV